MQKVSIVEQKLRLGLLTVEAAGKYLKIDSEEIAKAQEQKKTRDEAAIDMELKNSDPMKSGMQNQNLNNNKDVQRERDDKNKANKKKDTQNKNKQNAGGSKQTP